MIDINRNFITKHSLGGWWAYDNRTSDEIEETFQKQILAEVVDLSENTLQILICGTIYTIDFIKMIQYPQHMETRKRKIRREKYMPIKGVAGISHTI